MSKCRPSKWIIPAIVGAGLPWLGAYMMSTGKVVDTVKSSASLALGGDGMDWAKVALDGRDATISGTAPSQDALDAAVKAVAGAKGVRLVAQNVQVVPPVTLIAPTIESVTANVPNPEIKGTWQEGVAKTLAVTVAGATYKLTPTEKSPELTTSNGNWTLKPSQPLPPGSYDVTAEVSDGDKVTMAAPTPGKVVVELPAPEPLAAPTVEAPTLTNQAMPTFRGTWPEGKAAAFDVKVNADTYVWQKDPELKSDGAGNWTLTPSKPLAEGMVHVIPEVADAAGTVTAAASMAMTTIDLTAPAAPTLAAPPAGATWPYAITGTWAEEPGASLSAKLADSSYALGSPELSSDGKGNFTFAPKVELNPGSYDIDFTTTDAAGNSSTQNMKAAIVIAAAPEPAPAPAPQPAPEPKKIEISAAAVPADAKWPFSLSGTWSADVAKSLTATIEGRTFELGKDAALVSEAAGTFKFSPPADLAPGEHTVTFTSRGDGDQTVSSDVTFTVPAAAQPAPAPAPAPAKPEMAAPTVARQLDLTGAPIIKGTWPSAVAKALTVSLNGKTYTLGQDANLSAKGDAWSLLPSVALKDGIYDVAVAATDADGATKKDETVAEIEVDAVPPALPTVATYEGVKSPESISGTWDAKEGKGLKVSIPAINVTAELGGPDGALTSDGDGNWTMKLSTPLAPGKYDINAESTDIQKRVQVDATAGEVVIDAPAPPPAAYDCLAVLDRVDKTFPIRFDYDHDDVKHPYDLTLQYYAAVLKDSRCANVKVEVAGHADFRGTEEYNQDLSERRSQTIIDMLVKDGIDASRLVKKGYSKDKPLDPAKTDEARAKNRRVEITATTN